MGGQRRFQSLLEWLEGTDDINLGTFFAELQSLHRLENVLHASQPLDANIEKTQSIAIIAALNAEAFQEDTAQALISKLLSPFWNKTAPGLLKLADMVEGKQEGALARSLALGTHAYILRLVRSDGARVLMSFHANSGEEDWQETSLKFMRDLTAPAALFLERQNDPRLQPEKRAVPKLTSREFEVLSWVAVGKGYWEVSRILDISERTVRMHMGNIRDKLNAVSNKQAVAEAALLGLVDAFHPGRPRSSAGHDN